MEGGAPRWTRAQVTAILRQASGGKPLSQSAYRSWRERHGGPTVHTIRRLFGSFPAARKAAGLTAPRPDASAVVEAVAALWRELGRRPTRDDWRRWPARPCGLAWLTRQTGSWSRAVEKASRLLRPESVPRHPSAAAEHLLSVSPAHLTPRERQIADLLRAGASLQEAGQKLGLSRERVRQIAKAAGHHRRRPWADLTASRPPVTTPRGDHAATQRHPKTAGR
jgi:DNA-binding CsgD family transcriptional regulator